MKHFIVALLILVGVGTAAEAAGWRKAPEGSLTNAQKAEMLGVDEAFAATKWNRLTEPERRMLIYKAQQAAQMDAEKAEKKEGDAKVADAQEQEEVNDRPSKRKNVLRRRLGKTPKRNADF